MASIFHNLNSDRSYLKTQFCVYMLYNSSQNCLSSIIMAASLTNPAKLSK